MDLHIAFDEVKRSDGHVSETTAENSSYSTSSIEGRRVHLDLVGRFGRRRNDKALCLRDCFHIRCEAGAGARSGVEHLLQRKSFGRRRGVEEARDQSLTRGFLCEIHDRLTERKRV